MLQKLMSCVTFLKNKPKQKTEKKKQKNKKKTPVCNR